MLLAVGEHVLGDVEPREVRMTTGLAGGVGSTHKELCGALSGGILIIGGLQGRTSSTEEDEVAQLLAARYRARFVEEWSTTQCEQLQERITTTGQPASCARLVERSAYLLLELLEEE
jgi:C_GCAxxG_C_C family probable redox protein